MFQASKLSIRSTLCSSSTLSSATQQPSVSMAASVLCAASCWPCPGANLSSRVVCSCALVANPIKAAEKHCHSTHYKYYLAACQARRLPASCLFSIWKTWLIPPSGGSDRVVRVAPALINTPAASACPLRKASCSGVSWLLFGTSTLAFAAKRIRRDLVEPSQAARWRGVAPSRAREE